MNSVQKNSNYFKNYILPYVKSEKAVLGICIILFISFLAVFSNIISNFDPHSQGDLVQDRFLPPSWEHPFGTDKFGRDVFCRVIYGGRISLSIGISVVLLSMTIGVIYGGLSGYFAGHIDGIMMRILDFLLAFPSIFLIITVVALFKTAHWYIILLLALTGWMETARLIRAEVLSLKEREYILAAKGLGFSNFRILFRHIIPNCLHIVLASAPLKVAEIILLESALSFLGIGIQPPTPSWGNIINDGRHVLLNAWWVSSFPGLFITLTVLGFHLLSDGIREKLASGKVY
jgi:peptide/nickel transport system permease protein